MTINRKPYRKVTNLKSKNEYFSWVGLIGL